MDEVLSLSAQWHFPSVMISPGPSAVHACAQMGVSGEEDGKKSKTRQALKTCSSHISQVPACRWGKG
jgi:hypothetical protein